MSVGVLGNLALLARRCLLPSQTMITTRSRARQFSSAGVSVRHESAKQRFTAELDGNAAKLDYHVKDNVITFIHTEVPEVFRGKGVGKVLAQEAFKHAKDKNLKVRIECDYLMKYYNENSQQYKTLMAD